MMQMSPLFPKDVPSRTGTALSDDTVTPIAYQQEGDLSIDAILAKPTTRSPKPGIVRTWTSQQVVDWFFRQGMDEYILECLEMNDVNGTILLNLKFDDLYEELGIDSFGKRHLVWDEIGRLRGDVGDVGGVSPQPTPFQDISRPCTTNTNRRSPSRSRNVCQTPIDDDVAPITPAVGKKRRGRKPPKTLDVVSPAESVSIVAVEQLIPKPHKCTKGDHCPKWRKQNRDNKHFEEDNEQCLGRFPISPTRGGRIHVTGDPGNARTAENIIPNVHKAPSEDPFRPASNMIPSMVASSDVLGQSQLPPFALHPDMLEQIEKRDAQANVHHFLAFQHLRSSPNAAQELADPGSIARSESVPLFPAHHFQAYPSLQPPARSQTSGPLDNLKTLPRLEIPRSATAAPQLNAVASPVNIISPCRSASPESIYRLGTPASEMDVPVTAVPSGPVARDASQSVPPNMQFRQQTALGRSPSTRNVVPDWRRPSMAMALPALKEGEVLSPASGYKSSRPSLSSHNSSDSQSSLRKLRDPSHHSPTTQSFGYGPDCTHAGWMKKRKTKMLRHEWQETHCRLKGTELAMHSDAHFQSAKKDTINVDDYAVACSSVASTNKLSAAMKAFHIKNSAEAAKKAKQAEADPTAFAFQLVPSKDSDKKAAANGKTHHFAVKTKDERIDWMRELMLAKALQQKGKGYDVEVNGVQA